MGKIPPDNSTPASICGDDSKNAQTEKNRQFPVILLSGLSGAGKSSVANVLEDIGYFTIDGLPPTLIPEISSVLNQDSLPQYCGLVIGLDLRLIDSPAKCEKVIATLKHNGIKPHIVFIEASPEVIMRRYATTRRPHPLESEGMGLEHAVSDERERLLPIRDLAELVIDSSTYSIHELRRVIQKKFGVFQEKVRNFKVHLISFGFKYGIPAEADMILDLRFIPNPYFVEELRPMSGLDKPVADYVLNQEPGSSFLPKTLDFLTYLLPLYESEGRYRFTLAIGCTGGRHRSVAITEAVAANLKSRDYPVTSEHRNLELG